MTPDEAEQELLKWQNAHKDLNKELQKQKKGLTCPTDRCWLPCLSQKYVTLPTHSSRLISSSSKYFLKAQAK
eukprot:g63809.t1